MTRLYYRLKLTSSEEKLVLLNIILCGKFKAERSQRLVYIRFDIYEYISILYIYMFILGFIYKLHTYIYLYNNLYYLYYYIFIYMIII